MPKLSTSSHNFVQALTHQQIKQQIVHVKMENDLKHKVEAIKMAITV